MLIKMKERKPMGFWKSLDNVIMEVDRIMRENIWSEIPGQKRLIKLGRSNLAAAIIKYHGGFRKFRKSLGEKDREEQKPKGYWSLNNTISECEKVMKEKNWKILPSGYLLRKSGYSSLAGAIEKNGGIPKFRKLFGQNTTYDNWSTIESIIEYTKQIMEENGWNELPGQYTLTKMKYGAFVNAINKYYGGFRKFREILGQRQKKLVDGQWKDLEFTLNYTKNLIEKYGWQNLPNQNVLFKSGESGLVNSIRLYHGGFPAFRIKLNQYLGRKTEKEELERLLRRYTN